MLRTIDSVKLLSYFSQKEILLFVFEGLSHDMKACFSLQNVFHKDQSNGPGWFVMF